MEQKPRVNNNSIIRRTDEQVASQSHNNPGNVEQFHPLAVKLLVVLVSEIKNQLLLTSHALAVVNLNNLTPTKVACGCQRNGCFIQ